MIRDIALGQYIPGKSFIHRMDPRVKIALTFLFIIFLFVANGYVGMGVMVALVLAVLLLSRKQYLDEGDIGQEGKTEGPCEHIRIFRGMSLKIRDAVYNGEHRLLLQCLRERIDIAVVGVKRGLVDTGQSAQLFHCNLFQWFLCPQLHKCVADRFLCFFRS